MDGLHLALFAMRDLCSQVPCTGLRSLLKNHRLFTAFPDTAQCFQRQSLGQGNSSAKDVDEFSESYKTALSSV